MRILFDLSELGRTRWYEYAVRFVFGGLATLFVGILATKFGPSVAGLFLAFPAIFPATATLLEKHQTEKKRQAGISRTTRGIQAAALDAAGAAIGALGLICFAIVVWKGLPVENAASVLLAGTVAWLGVSTLIWRVRKSRVWH